MKKTLFISALILISAAAVLYSSLPLLINHSSPLFLTKYERADTTLAIDKLTLTTVVAALTLNNGTGDVVEFPRVEAGFSLKGLAQKKIAKVLISGGVIHLEMIDGVLQLQGTGPADNEKDPAQTPAQLILPFAAEEISLKNLSIIVHREDDDDLEVVIDGTINIDTTKNSDTGRLIDQVQCTLTCRGDLQAVLKFTLDGSSERINVHGQLATRNLASLSSVLLPPSLQLYGSGQLETDITLSRNLTILQSTSELQLADLLVTTPSLTISSPRQEAVTMTVQGNGDGLSYSISELELTHKESGFSFFTSFVGTLKPADFELVSETTISSPLLSEPLVATLNGENIPDGYHGTASLSGNYQNLRVSGMNIETGPYTISTDLVTKDGRTSVKAAIGIDSLVSAGNEISFDSVSAQLSAVSESALLTDAQGKLDIGNITYGSEDMGDAAFTFSSAEKGDSLLFNGSLAVGIADNFQLDIQGSVNSQMELHAEYDISPLSLDNNALPSFFTAGDDLLFGGIVSAAGEVHYPPATGPTNLSLQLKEGFIRQDKRKLDIRGIAGAVNFPDLPRLHSGPGQHITAQSLKLHTLTATEADVFFRIEDDLSLFLEKSRLKWCGGKVEVAATKISSRQEDFSTTMYCDRLQFSELLNQFGISDTEGDGSLNGRLPVEFSKDGLFFDDGFLFSTPGNSGIVRFNSTDILQRGLPDMSQAAYLDYSLMALNNFSYNWTKLTFNSIDNDLLITMQIDGKPAEPLPFGYKKGHIVADPKGTGIQHPLQLTVNFNLPIREMFRYGQNLQKIMENM